MISLEQYLRESAVPRSTIDTFLDPTRPTWAQFDSDVGYILGNALPHDGLDGCWTLSSTQNNGARTAHLYAGKPCRLNTYGDSFTQCHQVSDGETWQEYLAGHLGEPIRNFGMGGLGVYQAYRRMIRTEQTDDRAQYNLLYLWGDDHSRSLLRCRYPAFYRNWDNLGGMMFHGNFWSHLEMNLDSGKIEEQGNLLPTHESLYHMTDPDFMFDSLKDDLMLQLYVAGSIDPATLDLDRLNRLAKLLGTPALDASTPERLNDSSYLLRNAYGFAASKFILERAFDFCRIRGKKLMIPLLCPTVTWELLANKPRYDQEIISYLEEKGYPYFDMNQVHLRDYRNFNLSIEDYLKRYFIGHYNPVGNHFFAYSIKDVLVQWMDPKPITYRNDGSRMMDFKGYLPDRENEKSKV